MSSPLVPAALRYADQVARSGSIQRAAKELHIAASAINRQILQLEQALGVPLFERIARGMRLTPAGDVVVTLARRWHADERRAAADIRQLQGLNQGHVRLVAMDSHVNSFLPDLVDELAREHPRISLEIEIVSTDVAAAALLGGTADLAAVFNLSPQRDLHVLWSAELPLGCVVAPHHALCSRTPISMQEVAAFPIALQSKSLVIRRYLETRHGWLFEGHKAVETNSLQLVKILAKSGRYVAFTSELDAAPELVDGSLVFLPVRDKGAEPQTVAVAIDGRKPPNRITRIVAEMAAAKIQNCLQSVRRPTAMPGSRPAAAEPL